MQPPADWANFLEFDQERLEDLRFVGYSYLQQGHYEIALTFFQALVILSHNAPYDMRTLGAIHLELGNNLSALHYIEIALEAEPEVSINQLNRVKALLMLGYKKQGLLEADRLAHHPEETISQEAQALVLSYS